MVCCSDAGLHDRVIIQDIIKGAAQTQQLDAASQRNFKGMRCCSGIVLDGWGELLCERISSQVHYCEQSSHSWSNVLYNGGFSDNRVCYVHACVKTL